MVDDSSFSVNIERFTGFADVYDSHRPQPPRALADLLLRLVKRPAGSVKVADLGCGTGLSSRYWGRRAAQVTGVEPSDSMRAQAEQLGGENVRYVKGFSHATGLPDASVQIVTCSQSLHWMEPEGTFAEAARLLEKGGVFAAFDYDWPPVTGIWEVDDAYSRAEAKCRELEGKTGVSTGLRQWDKSGHLARMQASGAFRWCRELLLHHEETGDAERLMGLFLSQGFVQQLKKAGYSDAELGLDTLRAVAESQLGSVRRSRAVSAPGSRGCGARECASASFEKHKGHYLTNGFFEC